jgi:hypothetical protein
MAVNGYSAKKPTMVVKPVGLNGCDVWSLMLASLEEHKLRVKLRKSFRQKFTAIYYGVDVELFKQNYSCVLSFAFHDKACKGSRDIDSLIFNLDIRCWSVGSFTPRLLYPRKEHRYPLNRRLVILNYRTLVNYS